MAQNVVWADGQTSIETVSVRVYDQRIDIQAGCNTLSPYKPEILDQALVSESVVGTDMGCSALLVEQDAWIAKLLGSRPAISVTSAKFELRSSDAELVAAAVA